MSQPAMILNRSLLPSLLGENAVGIIGPQLGVWDGIRVKDRLMVWLFVRLKVIDGCVVLFPLGRPCQPLNE